MAVLQLTAERLLGLFRALLPEGRVWPEEAGTSQERALAALMPTYERLAARDANLLIDAFPGSTYELLPEWEATLGLPDECIGIDSTVAQRRQHVVAQLTAQGGQSVPYFVDFAAKLGFTITVEEFTPARAGFLRAGDALNSEGWAHTWRVHAPSHTVVPFRADASSAGEPLAAWGNASLQCALSRIRPAHTIIQFAYGS